MNLYIIALLEGFIQTKLAAFSVLNIVKSAVYLCDLKQLALKLNIIGSFYLNFWQKIGFLPLTSFNKELFGPFDINNIAEPAIAHVITKIRQTEIVVLEAIPIYLHFTDENLVHLVGGLVRFEKEDGGYLFLLDLNIAKSDIKNIPHNSRYVIDIIQSYEAEEKLALRELVRIKGLNYNQFQKDCKVCFGDTFYAFLLKLKMMEAASDIIYTTMSLKEIAFKNKFPDYSNMYKTFVRYGINPTQIPRLANL
ncbi:hypothetical protein AAW12_23835 [Sphingobacterium sp. Ag1]|uniref:AraC family transcriptional regulator n=1 Tax=Sphingobacterium sp. Ag1 TaxID=1643451 RepID=UPI000627F3F0|nr:helix-turn-helix domain-containing protein [Sphingobacterium sp. Ag1]KKO89163.1 hypothetical protein AAW12_23835 [Sphingobacterium sp. Ag1]